jgi:hypothetical protein
MSNNTIYNGASIPTKNIKGFNNSGFGNYATYTVTDGSSNTALGVNALKGNQIGNYNTAIGSASLQQLRTGLTGFDPNENKFVTLGCANTALGARAGFYDIKGSCNTYIGAQSGQAQLDKHVYGKSTAIGYDARFFPFASSGYYGITAPNGITGPTGIIDQVVIGTTGSSVIIPGSVTILGSSGTLNASTGSINYLQSNTINASNAFASTGSIDYLQSNTINATNTINCLNGTITGKDVKGSQGIYTDTINPYTPATSGTTPIVKIAEGTNFSVPSGDINCTDGNINGQTINVTTGSLNTNTINTYSGDTVTVSSTNLIANAINALTSLSTPTLNVSTINNNSSGVDAIIVNNSLKMTNTTKYITTNTIYTSNLYSYSGETTDSIDVFNSLNFTNKITSSINPYSITATTISANNVSAPTGSIDELKSVTLKATTVYATSFTGPSASIDTISTQYLSGPSGSVNVTNGLLVGSRPGSLGIVKPAAGEIISTSNISTLNGNIYTNLSGSKIYTPTDGTMTTGDIYANNLYGLDGSNKFLASANITNINCSKIAVGNIIGTDNIPASYAVSANITTVNSKYMVVDMSANGISIFAGGAVYAQGGLGANTIGPAYGSSTLTNLLLFFQTVSLVPGIGVSFNAPSFISTSDYRIKENVVPIAQHKTELTVDKLNPVIYHNTQMKKTDMGFIAHELQEEFPFLVTGEKDGEEYQSINYLGLIALLVKEVQELKKIVKSKL